MSDTRPPEDDLPGGPLADVAEYALGLLPEPERSVFEARLETDADLRAELVFWQEHLASMAASEVAEVTPPPQVFNRLEATLYGPVRKPLWRLLLPYAVGGALAALALWVAVTANLLVPPDSVSGPVLQARLEATPDGGDLALLARFDAATEALVVDRAAGAPPEGRVHELWLIAGDNPPVSLGLLDPGGDTVLQLAPELATVLPGATLAVSDEPPGGSPTGAPTGQVRAAGTVTSS